VSGHVSVDLPSFDHRPALQSLHRVRRRLCSQHHSVPLQMLSTPFTILVSPTAFEVLLPGAFVFGVLFHMSFTMGIVHESSSWRMSLCFEYCWYQSLGFPRMLKMRRGPRPSVPIWSCATRPYSRS
jgi:hypothetical protein